MARKRFTPTERQAFAPGVAVEWRNGRHWHPGTVSGPIVTDSDGWHGVALTNHATTRTCHAGQRITGIPGAVRLPATPAEEHPATAQTGGTP